MDQESNPSLNLLRKQLDELDHEWVKLFTRRFEVTRAVGLLKKTENLPCRDPGREEQQYRRIEDMARQLGLSPKFAKRILELLIEEVVREHEELRR